MSKQPVGNTIMAMEKGIPSLETKSRDILTILGVRGVAKFIRKLRDGFTTLSVSIDPGADSVYEYVFPYSHYHGRVDPSIEMTRENLGHRYGPESGVD